MGKDLFLRLIGPKPGYFYIKDVVVFFFFFCKVLPLYQGLVGFAMHMGFIIQLF